VLSGLQERIARILAELPEARDFALASGAALIATRLVDRRTNDLDFFADRPEAVLELLPVLEDSLHHAGLQVERRQAQAGFARLAVSDGAEITEVDLCYDVRLQPPEVTPLFNLPALADALGSTRRIPEQALEVADVQVAREILAWAARERARILGAEGG
jgi:hypothetical protein